MFCRSVEKFLETKLSPVVTDDVPTLQEGYGRACNTRLLTGNTPTRYDKAMVLLHMMIIRLECGKKWDGYLGRPFPLWLHITRHARKGK